MKVVTFATTEQKALGLQYFPAIPEDTIYYFPDIRPGTVFHSRNVPEPFEIAFISRSGLTLKKTVMTPPLDSEQAPPGTSYVYEARPGVLRGL